MRSHWHCCRSPLAFVLLFSVYSVPFIAFAQDSPWSPLGQPPARAKFNYVVDTGVPLVRYIDWPEMEPHAVLPQYRSYEMSVRDGRPFKHTFDIDTHGFVFVDHVTQVKDFTDEAERARVYDAEVQALIKKHSGASEVVVFDHTIRVGDESAQSLGGIRAPVKSVHNDCTEKSAPRRLRDSVSRCLIDD